MAKMSKEKLDWLRRCLKADSLSSLITEARTLYPDEDLVPAVLLAGRTGAGKSSLINALAGCRTAETGVTPTTQDRAEIGIDDSGEVPLRVLDMPGIGEASKHQEREDALLAAAREAHVILLTVPCPERNLEYEAALLADLRSCLGEPDMPFLALAATKIDCAAPVREWDPATLNLTSPATEKERNILDWLKYATHSLHTEMPLVACAAGSSFDDRENQYGIDDLRRTIYSMLPEAASSHFARVLRDAELTDKRAAEIVKRCSSAAALAASQPLPGIPDTVLIMPLQVVMLMQLTRLHGRRLTADLAAQLAGTVAARMTGRFLVTQVTKLIPGVGSLAGAAVAGSLTYALGMAFHTLLQRGSWNFSSADLQQEVLKWWHRRHHS